jgi:hypothetical protein
MTVYTPKPYSCETVEQPVRMIASEQAASSLGDFFGARNLNVEVVSLENSL